MIRQRIPIWERVQRETGIYYIQYNTDGNIVNSQNRCILIKKTDWEKVYKNLEDNPTSFARYYSLMRVDSGKNNLSKLTSALMVNDDLYRYTKELVDNINETKESN